MVDVVRAQPSLVLAGAQRAIEGAVACAERMDVPVCVAVTDRAGHLLAYARMDRAPLFSEQIARDKAYSVAAFNGRPTHEWWDAIADDPPVRSGLTSGGSRLIIFGGGVPIRVAGELVGAIGVSGGSAEQDRDIADSGAAALT